jgi:hypothetical protein
LIYFWTTIGVHSRFPGPTAKDALKESQHDSIRCHARGVDFQGVFAAF